MPYNTYADVQRAINSGNYTPADVALRNILRFKEKGSWFDQNGNEMKTPPSGYQQLAYQETQMSPQQGAAQVASQQVPQQSSLEMLLSQMNDNYKNQDNTYAKLSESTNETRNRYLDMLKRMEDKEENAPTGNPFIDMLDGYIRMKKQKNPDYQWGGLAVPAAKGIGWLGKQAGNGISGLIGMLKGRGE